MNIYLKKYQIKNIERMLLKKVVKYMKNINKITEPTEYRREFCYNKLTDVLDILYTLDGFLKLDENGKNACIEARKLMNEHPVVKYPNDNTNALSEAKNVSK